MFLYCHSDVNTNHSGRRLDILLGYDGLVASLLLGCEGCWMAEAICHVCHAYVSHSCLPCYCSKLWNIGVTTDRKWSQNFNYNSILWTRDVMESSGEKTDVYVPLHACLLFLAPCLETLMRQNSQMRKCVLCNWANSPWEQRAVVLHSGIIAWCLSHPSKTHPYMLSDDKQWDNGKYEVW